MMMFGLVIALVGALLTFAGQRMFWIRQLARWRGEIIVGEIVKWERTRMRGRSDSGGTRVLFRPRVKLVDRAGVERTALVSYQHPGAFKDLNPSGSAYCVLFDPRHPERFLDTTWTMGFILPIHLTFCGVLVLLVGIGMAFGST